MKVIIESGEYEINKYPFASESEIIVYDIKINEILDQISIYDIKAYLDKTDRK